jgi:hypothetical protein
MEGVLTIHIPDCRAEDIRFVELKGDLAYEFLLQKSVGAKRCREALALYDLPKSVITYIRPFRTCDRTSNRPFYWLIDNFEQNLSERESKTPKSNQHRMDDFEKSHQPGPKLVIRVGDSWDTPFRPDISTEVSILSTLFLASAIHRTFSQSPPYIKTKQNITSFSPVPLTSSSVSLFSPLPANSVPPPSAPKSQITSEALLVASILLSRFLDEMHQKLCEFNAISAFQKVYQPSFDEAKCIFLTNLQNVKELLRSDGWRNTDDFASEEMNLKAEWFANFLPQFCNSICWDWPSQSSTCQLLCDLFRQSFWSPSKSRS